jgi:stringent starvation protein B
MTSSKPYLIRGIYDWLLDNELTPYLVVDATMSSVQVPEENIDDGRIILNISPKACRGLHLGNDRVVFSARFSGEVKQIFLPPTSILAIYAKENGRGMVFSDEDEEEVESPKASPPSSSNSSGKPTLTVVE